jgi:DNA polymerase-1
MDREIENSRLDCIMILQVHDELIFEASRDEAPKIAPIVKEIMETAYPMNVPIVADVRIGQNWLEAHD